MARIVICRHGNTFDKGDVVTRVGARTDLPLSSSGQIQAAKLSVHFAQYNFTQAFCSPLRRTQETAQALLAEHKAELMALPFLTEIDYGIDENKPEAEVVARLGKAAIELWDAQAIPPDGWKVDPEGLRAAWAAFFKAHEKAQRDILVVTSNGVARFVLDVVTGVSSDTPRKLRTAAFGVIELGSGQANLVSWDERSA